MGILQSVREKIGNKMHEMHERRESDRQEFEEHYNKKYDAARRAEIKRTAEKKAAQDAYDRVHPMERVSRGINRIQELGGKMDAKGRGGSGSSLSRKVAPLGDFGRSIGQGYEKMKAPSWMDFDKPKKKPGKKRSITINY